MIVDIFSFLYILFFYKKWEKIEYYLKYFSIDSQLLIINFLYQIIKHFTKQSLMLKQLEPLVVDIKEDPEPIIIQSLCVDCKSNGETILLMTKIPFFRDILIGSFRCE